MVWRVITNIYALANPVLCILCTQDYIRAINLLIFCYIYVFLALKLFLLFYFFGLFNKRKDSLFFEI